MGCGEEDPEGNKKGFLWVWDDEGTISSKGTKTHKGGVTWPLGKGSGFGYQPEACRGAGSEPGIEKLPLGSLAPRRLDGGAASNPGAWG